MKRLLSFFVCVLFFSATLSGETGDLSVLFELIARKSEYENLKQNEIDEIKLQLNTPGITLLQRYEINYNIAGKYSSFKSDSSAVYYSENIRIATELGDKEKIEESLLLLSGQYILMGLYIDVEHLLDKINPKGLSRDNLRIYYDARKSIYMAISEGNDNRAGYLDSSKCYRDSLLAILDPGSAQYRFVMSEILCEQGEYELAEKELLPLIEGRDFSSREVAMTAYAISQIYHFKGDFQKEIEYLVLSVSADIRDAVKENIAILKLAVRMYEQGEDIEDVYRLIHSAMEDAVFCNSQMRLFEISNIYPIINSAYSASIESKDRLWLVGFILVSILLLTSVALIVYVFGKMRQITRIKEEQKQANRSLKLLNKSLTKANDDLVRMNADLKQANLIKQAYITEFLETNSRYIDKIDSYRRKIYRIASSETHQDLLKRLRSKSIIEGEVKELLQDFDKVFLRLFPDFVVKLNELLVPDRRFELKKDGELNVELRIYALIRLGITESSDIAHFLRYSPVTIYNYRTRVRNRAKNRADFELQVQKIG